MLKSKKKVANKTSKSASKKSKRVLTVSPINRCEFQGNVIDIKYTKSQNGPMFAGKIVLDNDYGTKIFIRAFREQAKELYEAVEEGDPVHVVCEYSPFRTREGEYFSQFIVREIVEVKESNKSKSKKYSRDDEEEWDDGSDEEFDIEFDDDEEEEEEEDLD